VADEDWNEYRRLVLAELTRLTERIDGLSAQISRLESDVAVLKSEIRLKSGVWGAIAGAIPAAVAIVWIITRA
jgi:hypothetical protein